MKKLFTLIVAICATTLAWADDSGSCGENVTYSFVESTGTLTISGTGDMYSYSDVSNRPWHNYRYHIKKVVINNGVTSIGWRAFSYCEELTSITIPNSVTSIGNEAFYGCTRLTSITIPNSVTSIGNGAFSYCNVLTSITIPNSVTSIGEEAFIGCTGLTSVTIPNSITSIGTNAFCDCTELTSVTIPNSVTSIGKYAFRGCTGLTSITIPNSVTSIGSSAFSGCTGLTNVTIPNSVTSIGDDPFYNCNKLAYNTYSNGKYLGNDSNPYLYLCNTTGTDITNCKINENCKLIGNYAFSGCTELTSITIPNSVTSIGYSAFFDCTGLTSMTVEATNPPYYSSTNNIVSNYNIPLYVPAGSVDAYKAAEEWKNFTNIQAIPATGVNEAAAEKSEVKKIMIDGTVYIEAKDMRYNLNGQKVK